METQELVRQLTEFSGKEYTKEGFYLSVYFMALNGGASSVEAGNIADRAFDELYYSCR